MNIRENRFLVYGMGVSGRGSAELLKRLGAQMTLYDANEQLDMNAIIEELSLPGDTETISGSLSDQVIENTDVIVVSPGVRMDNPDIVRAKAAGVSVIGEVELAYIASEGRLAAITGTNGKTTTTTLVGEIMKAAFPEVFVVGNIGTSFAAAAAETSELSVTVAEISSFQLETIETFHPEVSAVLNITPDHLDRHGSLENYAQCKMRIAENQDPDDVCVINYDDEYLRELSKDITPHVVYFSRLQRLDEGVFLDGDDIILKTADWQAKVMSRSEINLMGDHNVENVMAAAAVAFSMGAEIRTIAEVIREFQAVEHRIEYVCTKNGVKYYNDSKGTNTDASAKAIESMIAPTILIAGGYDKGADFTDWIRGFGGKVKMMVLIGATAGKIMETAVSCGFTDLVVAGTLESAVDLCAQAAEPGDAVLLSPACASWDQFKNYEVRGRLFKEYVRALPDKE